MAYSLRAAFGIPMALLVAASRLGAQSRTAEDSVRDLESVRAQALIAADTTALGRITAEEFVEISLVGQLRTRADNLRDVASGVLRLTSVRHDSLVVSVYGDVALLRGIAESSGTYRGMPFAGRVRYTRTFVRRNGRWQAVAMQHTPMP